MRRSPSLTAFRHRHDLAPSAAEKHAGYADKDQRTHG